MESFYLVFVVILFALAISDLIVGVSNDAVNFLNSSIGSKAAPFKYIMIIASLGIIVGATFSSGMMEVARKGIFHPDQFYFSEIMVIFLAVMITDIILLDSFNTIGLPTSTTVSIVFELLGAAVAIGTIKVMASTDPSSNLAQYINTDKALAIISGILLSVVIAFTFGNIIQYIARLIFTFNYESKLKYLGAVFGGISITAITYFILIKGAKGSSFISSETADWIKNHTLNIIGFSLIGWTIFLQILQWAFKTNVLKLIVLVGTFALAMAFAGNDLVNFIGVPLAGYESYKVYAASSAGANEILMSSLTDPIKTPPVFLVIAGLVMAITLRLSKKARTVTQTEMNLSRQDVGYERFGSTLFARSIVRMTVSASKFMQSILPAPVNKFLDKRFDDAKFRERSKKDQISFDLVRASINLFVASILISIGTALKLPLSTTYVTFMVAMGSSLADRAWGSDSAVYRVTGVITVIGGWFFTAFSAFTVAFILAFAIYYGGTVAVIILLLIAGIILYRTHILHKTREKKKEIEIERIASEEKIFSENTVFQKCTTNIISTLVEASKLFYLTFKGLTEYDLRLLRKTKKDVQAFNTEVKDLKNNIPNTINKLRGDSVETGHYYVQTLDYLRELAHSLTFLNDPIVKHIDNNHKPILPIQAEDLKNLNQKFTDIFNLTLHLLKNKKFNNLNELIEEQKNILALIKSLRKRQIKLLKNNEVGTRNSMLYLNILSESKNLLLFLVNMVKSHRDFNHVIENNGKEAPFGDE